MKLIKAQVRNFKSIEDSGEFSVDEGITCLVGKNESGKTALLTALYRTNPIFPGDGTFDIQKDYPRRYFADYDERHPDGPAPVVTTWWRLDDDEKAAVAARLGPNALKSDEVRVTRGYANRNTWLVSFDEKAVVAHLLEESDLHDEEKAQVGAQKDVASLRAQVEKLSESERRKDLLAAIDEQFPKASVYEAIWATVHLPHFLLFSQYQRLQGQVSLEQIQARKANNQLDGDDQVFLALCEMARTTIEEVGNIKNFENLVARFEGASNKISQEIFRYWSQNRFLSVVFRLDPAQAGDPPPFNSGRVFRTRIHNQLHKATVAFDERSTGFVWFFSFLALFSQIKKRHTGKLVLLLDEPGLSLHGKAQADLLRYFRERLRPDHQVVYTTHSPFIVPTDNIMSTRTVEDVVVHRPGEEPEVFGTKVRGDTLSTDRDTLFPLQGALGYEITQSLFVGEHTLLVEGPSDLLYLKAMSEELRSRNRTALDKRWVVCPAGGVDKVAAFTSLFGGNRLHVAVLTDFASGQKRKIEELRRSTLLRSGHVLTADTYAGQSEADIEDLLGSAVYVELVNACYGLKGKQAVPIPEGSVRIVKHVEEHFRTLPSSVDEFDHFAPAAYLTEHRSSLMKKATGLDESLQRFEKLFQELNSMLNEEPASQVRTPRQPVPA